MFNGKTKLMVVHTPSTRLEAALGPEWLTIAPGQMVSGRFDVIVVPKENPRDGVPPYVYEQWIKEGVLCRLASREAQIFRT